MAPAGSLPNIDLTLTQEIDIQQSYWLLFDKMKDDFVVKEDLDRILRSATVNGGTQVGNSGGPVPVIAARIAHIPTDTTARQKAFVYSKLAKTGGATRQAAIKGLETTAISG